MAFTITITDCSSGSRLSGVTIGNGQHYTDNGDGTYTFASCDDLCLAAGGMLPSAGTIPKPTVQNVDPPVPVDSLYVKVKNEGSELIEFDVSLDDGTGWSTGSFYLDYEDTNQEYYEITSSTFDMEIEVFDVTFHPGHSDPEFRYRYGGQWITIGGMSVEHDHYVFNVTGLTYRANTDLEVEII